MIPTATTAHFDHIYAELTVLICHHRKFSRILDASGVGPQLVAEHIRHMDKFDLVAHRTWSLGGLAVVLSCAKQIRVGILMFTASERVACADAFEYSSSGQSEINH